MAEQTSSEQSRNMILQAIFGVVVIQLLYWICREAYDIRMYAVKEYGRIIHEFDPYFNYRATEVRLYVLSGDASFRALSAVSSPYWGLPEFTNSTSTPTVGTNFGRGSTTKFGILSDAPSEPPFILACR